MKLYYTPGACSLVVHIVINELGLKAEYESVDLKTKKTEKGLDFLGVNSKGSVPTLMTDDNQVLTENAVILQYLADTTKAINLLPPIGDFERYRVLEWLNFCTTELHKGFGHLFNPLMPTEAKDKVIKPLLEKKLAYVNEHLATHAFLVGEHFTLPDAYLYVMLRWADHFKINSGDHLKKYFAELKNRAAVKLALKDEGLS